MATLRSAPEMNTLETVSNRPLTSRASLLEAVEMLRLEAAQRLDARRKGELGQFFTSAPLASLMASMLRCDDPDVHVLDAASGVGSLFAAVVSMVCCRHDRPRTIRVTAYEVDSDLASYARRALALCDAACAQVGIEFQGEIHVTDFIEDAIALVHGDLFGDLRPNVEPTCAILNPPYRKIHSDSRHRKLLRHLGIETSNLYTGFLVAAMQLLSPDGEMVAITPRSFCNGPYFRPFRQHLLGTMSLRRIHVFESREDSFRDDEVLQENVIFSAAKSAAHRATIAITASATAGDELILEREVEYDRVVRPGDPEAFIHIVPDDLGHHIAERIGELGCALNELGLQVSTGRVVDFRARPYLRQEAGPGAVPLIYPAHFDQGYVTWPNALTRKPNALAMSEYTKPQVVPNEHYVLVRRFSAKEERRRIVAAVYDAERVPCDEVGFENHLNYFHQSGRGLSLTLARGLAAFLNSTLVDAYFRQFSGHTQVNATDLRSLRYPTREQLERLGSRIAEVFPEQRELDALVSEELFGMPEAQVDPVQAKQRIDEAIEALRALGMPRPQLQERSGLTLLALLDLRPETPWSGASNPLRGITPMMDFFRQNYGKNYAPDTRETVRRQTIHQFVDAALAVINPDKPDRPTNSGQTVYQIEKDALELLRSFGGPEWDVKLKGYLAHAGTLKERYARARQLARLPVNVRPGLTLSLTPGGQNPIVQRLIDDFGPLFTPGGTWLYIGDTGEKFPFIDEEGLSELGVTLNPHGKMPDVIVYHAPTKRLVLIEAVRTHGPISAKRRDDLEKLFGGAEATPVFVSAFMDRKTFARRVHEIDWETEVWIAEEPEHLIHFNGDKFLPSPSETREGLP